MSNKQKKITWSIERIDCGKELVNTTVADNLPSYDTARRRLTRIANDIGAKITKDSKGEEVIILTEGKDAVLYWIVGRVRPNTVDNKPELFSGRLPKSIKYYQPESKLTGEVPKTLASFYVFRSTEDCRTWLHRMGYLESEYEIKEYSGNDIEDPWFLDV